MTESKNVYTIAPLEFDIFFGLDVDKRSVSITILDHVYKIRSLTLPNKAEMIINYTKKHFLHKRVVFVYETGPTGYGLYDQLTQAGYPCLVVTPSMVPTQAGERVKTNRLDSVRLAQTLRGGELNGVRVPSRTYRDLRHLVHLYKIISKQSTSCKCRIKALLLVEGIAYPNTCSTDHWSRNTIRKLQTMDCIPSVRFNLDMLLENLLYYRRQLLTIRKEIRHFCRSDSDLCDSIKFLLSLPGIGWVLSPIIMARIGDWRNLKNVKELAGFLGLTPCEQSTGDDVNKGSITRTGDAYLRNLLIEASWAAIRKDPELADFYHRIYNRHPRDRAPRKAIVAVARKLTTRIYAVLTQRRLYIPGYREYNLNRTLSDKKRRSLAPEDASRLRRVRRYTKRRVKNDSPVLTASLLR